jgi:predicted PurR-regulated permease PerM
MTMAETETTSPPVGLPPPTRSEIAAWIIAGFALLTVLWLHLLPALLAGLLVYELVHLTTPLLQRYLSNERARVVAVSALAVLMVGAVTAAVTWLVVYLRGEGHLTRLLQKMAQIINQARTTLPESVTENLPDNADELRAAAVHWLETHARALQTVGENYGRGLAHILIGLVAGAMVSQMDVRPHSSKRPLARALGERVTRLGNAFRRIVFAQVRISAVNTTLTALFLLVGLRLFGVHLPLLKTLIAITFVVGLLPVVGNLISNAIIVIVGLNHSMGAALACLGFLVLVHKLEYFLNARIVGGQIRARAWELLIAMLVMEAAFGLPGIVAAPIYYAYLKDELGTRQLV